MQLPCLTPASFQVRPPWLIYIELGAAQKLAPKYASESERGARAVYLKVGLQQISSLDLKALVINNVKLCVCGLRCAWHGFPDRRPAAAA